MTLSPSRMLAGLLMICAVAAVAQTPSAGESEAERRARFDQIPNTPGDGPYPAMLEVDPALPDHVVYRPADLAPFTGARRLAVLVWGNGGCSNDGASQRLHLAEIASYGYLVIAPGSWRSGPGAIAPRTAPPRVQTGGILPAPATSTADVRAGLDWALAQNKRAGSKYRGKVDPAKVAVGGHSCGGLQAIELAADPRVRTVLVHNSGIFLDGAQPIAGMRVSKDMLKGFHTPVVYFLGGPGDVAMPNGSDDVARLEHVPVAMAVLPVGHGGTFTQPMGGAVAHAAVDWLEWQLRGDKTAARTFLGANCRLCTGPGWTLTRKHFDG